MSEIKVNSIKGVAASAAAITVNNTDGTCTLASGSKLNNCTTDGTTNLTIADGNLVIGTSGHGIDFSATSNSGGSMVSELFSDYEIGTFTPVINLGVTSPTYDIQRGGYILIGRMLHFQYSIRVNGGTTNSSHLRFGGLPFSSFNGTAYTTAGANIGYQEGDFTDQQVFHIPQNGSDIRVYSKNGNVTAGNSHTIINKFINFYGAYIINH